MKVFHAESELASVLYRLLLLLLLLLLQLLILLLLLLLVIFYTIIILICYYFHIINELVWVKLPVTTVNAHIDAWLSGEHHFLLVYIKFYMASCFILTLHFNRFFCSNDIVML